MAVQGKQQTSFLLSLTSPVVSQVSLKIDRSNGYMNYMNTINIMLSLVEHEK